MKRLQNKIAEHGMTLSVAVCYTVGVWILAGGIQKQWWLQLLCFAASTVLVAVINDTNALLRVRSRMVSCTFLVLSAAVPFVFISLQGSFVQLCAVVSNLILFHSYQDKLSHGWTLYAFLCLGLASMTFVQALFFLPFLWLLMATQLLTLSWRTWAASLLGVMIPYWFLLPYYVYKQDFKPLADHFSALGTFSQPLEYAHLPIGTILAIILIALLTLSGGLHLWRYGYEDKIRTRQIYSCYTLMSWLTLLFLVLQPQHILVLMPLVIVNTSPIIAHFLTFTHTRVSNIAFFVIIGLIALLTALNLWMPSLTF